MSFRLHSLFCMHSGLVRLLKITIKQLDCELGIKKSKLNLTFSKPTEVQSSLWERFNLVSLNCRVPQNVRTESRSTRTSESLGLPLPLLYRTPDTFRQALRRPLDPWRVSSTCLLLPKIVSWTSPKFPKDSPARTRDCRWKGRSVHNDLTPGRYVSFSICGMFLRFHTLLTSVYNVQSSLLCLRCDPQCFSDVTVKFPFVQTELFYNYRSNNVKSY